MHLGYKSSFFVLFTHNKMKNAIAIPNSYPNLCKNVKGSLTDIIAIIQLSVNIENKFESEI